MEKTTNQELRHLNDIMYSLGYDMSSITDLVRTKRDITKALSVIDKLLVLSVQSFQDAIEEFDKINNLKYHQD